MRPEERAEAGVRLALQLAAVHTAEPTVAAAVVHAFASIYVACGLSDGPAQSAHTDSRPTMTLVEGVSPFHPSLAALAQDLGLQPSTVDAVFTATSSGVRLNKCLTRSHLAASRHRAQQELAVLLALTAVGTTGALVTRGDVRVTCRQFEVLNGNLGKALSECPVEVDGPLAAATLSLSPESMPDAAKYVRAVADRVTGEPSTRQLALVSSGTSPRDRTPHQGQRHGA